MTVVRGTEHVVPFRREHVEHRDADVVDVVRRSDEGTPRPVEGPRPAEPFGRAVHHRVRPLDPAIRDPRERVRDGGQPEGRGRPRGREPVGDQTFRLEVPGQDLRIEQAPVGPPLVPQSRRPDPLGHARDDLGLRVGPEEGATVTGPHPARPSVVAEATGGGLPVAAHGEDPARPHVLLLDHEVGHAGPPVVVERLLRPLQPSLAGGRGDGGDRRREVAQPSRVDPEPGERTDGGRGPVAVDPHGGPERGGDPARAGHVLDVGQAVVTVRHLPGDRRREGRRAVRPPVDAVGRHGHQVAFRPRERGQSPPEHAARVEVDGPVAPFGLRDDDVPVHDVRRPPVGRGPVAPHGMAVGVLLARDVAVERVGPHGPRRPSDHGLGQARVRDAQVAPVEPQVGRQGAQERSDLPREPLGLGREGGERRRKGVGRHHPRPRGQGARQLVVVVARDGERDPRPVHGHDRAQHARGVGAAVHEVAHEHGRAAVRGRDRGVRSVPVPDRVAQAPEEGVEFVRASVHVADHVEGAHEVAPVDPEGLPDDPERLYAVGLRDEPEPLLAQPLETPADLAAHAAHDRRTVRAIGTRTVAGDGDVLAGVNHDGDREGVVFLGDVHEAAPVGLAHVGRVHDGEAAQGETRAYDLPGQGEGGGGHGLVVRVVPDNGAAPVGRHDLGVEEVPGGEGALAGPGRPDQHHEGEVGESQRPDPVRGVGRADVGGAATFGHAGGRGGLRGGVGRHVGHARSLPSAAAPSGTAVGASAVATSRRTRTAMEVGRCVVPSSSSIGSPIPPCSTA